MANGGFQSYASIFSLRFGRLAVKGKFPLTLGPSRRLFLGPIEMLAVASTDLHATLWVSVKDSGDVSNWRQARRGFSPLARQVPKRVAGAILLLVPCPEWDSDCYRSQKLL